MGFGVGAWCVCVFSYVCVCVYESRRSCVHNCLNYVCSARMCAYDLMCVYVSVRGYLDINLDVYFDIKVHNIHKVAFVYLLHIIYPVCY